MTYNASHFPVFVAESNRIEGILRPPRAQELDAHAALMSAPVLLRGHLEAFVNTVQPGARLREHPGMDVRVGPHIPPPGGPEITESLGELLAAVNAGAGPFEAHVRYETLHPFMDGNGRSGRAVWLWQMLRQKETEAPLTMGFLHLFYYQTLQAWRP